MSNVIRENLYYSLYLEPDGTISEYTIMDETRRPMQYQSNPAGKTAEIFKQIHAVMPMAGPQTHAYIKSAAGNEKTLNLLSAKTGKSVGELNRMLLDTTNSIDVINSGIVGGNMSTPLLRFYIREVQVLHPDVTKIIHDNIDEYPYCKDISEQVGMQFTLVADINQLDALFTLDCNHLPNENIRTSGRMTRILYYKLFLSLYGMMEDAEKFLDCLFLRAMPCEENHMLFHPNYAKEGPTAHGNNYANDVFHLDRSVEAMSGVLNALVEYFGDRLRLVNTIIPLEVIVQSGSQVFTKTVEDTEMTVDRLNIVTDKTPRTNDVFKGTSEEFITDE